MEKGWRYLAVKNISSIKSKTSKDPGDFYCINCLHSFATEIKCKFHKKLCNNKYFCNIVILSEDTKILELNQDQQSDKHHFLFMQLLNI